MKDFKQIRSSALLLAVVLILLLRLLLFHNYFAWKFYSDHLSKDLVGRLQYDIIKWKVEYILQKASPKYKKYLAMGNSQTGSLYWLYSRSNPDINILTVGAMGPDTYIQYRDYIKAYRPEVLLLSLSEFDMAENRGFLIWKYTPFQGLYTFKLIEKAWHQAGGRIPDEIYEKVAGDIFPEYKYAYIFRGLLDKLLHHKPKARGMGAEVEIANKSDEEINEDIKQHHFKSIQGRSKKALDVNFPYIAEFLNYLKDEGIKVLIVEGQYNPDAYNEKTQKLNQLVRQRMQALTDKLDNAVYIPRSKLYQFKASDYLDGYHVKDVMGKKFVENLFTYLEQEGIFQ